MELLLVDDHPLFRAGLRLLLGSIGVKADVREADSLQLALREAARQPIPDLCLLDLGLHSSPGCTALQQLRDAVPQMPVVVVSAADDAATVHRCIEFGAMSFIPKSATPDILTRALSEVTQGRVWLPSHVLAAYPAVPLPRLTARQCDVLRGLQCGWPNKLIARELQISEATVKEHLGKIFRLLGARNRVDAVLKAAAWTQPRQ